MKLAMKKFGSRVEEGERKIGKQAFSVPAIPSAGGFVSMKFRAEAIIGEHSF